MSQRPDEGTIVDGRYRVSGRLGTGGMADVFCAEDLQLGRSVALKLLHERFARDEEFAERFRREASAAAGLQHPNVVAVYDRGEWEGASYIAMEFVDGRTLKELIQAEAPLDPARAIDLTIQVLRAARFAHKRGIIHRDLKPHNVMVDGEGRAKVTDFGIARAGASDMTETGSILGTAQYLSPEQAQGMPVNAASDLYSVGILLYELLTGRVPFEGDSAVAIALKQVSEAPLPPSHLAGGIPYELEQVVLRALEKDPARRFADADEMIAALEHAKSVLTSGAVATGATAIAAGVHGAPPTSVLPTTGPHDVTGYVGPAVPVAVAEQEERDQRWWIGLLAALVVVGLVIGALLLLSGGKDVTVPDVIGAQQDAAEQRLASEGLSSDSVTRTSDSPRGTVIKQDPEAGSEVEDGTTVRLTISDGPGQARIPDLRGEGRNTARRRLQQLDFEVTEREQSSDEVTTNRVIETVPAVGELLEKGETVTLVVSTGPESVGVPDVVGRTREEATSTLEGAGFDVAVREQEDEDREPGTVLAQDPAGGQDRRKGTTVTITVAKEPSDVEVPDVTGRTEAEAVQALSGAGFEVRTRERATTDPDEDGRVLEQSPTGRRERGSTVTITVGVLDPTQPPAQTTPTTPTTTTPGAETVPEG